MSAPRFDDTDDEEEEGKEEETQDKENTRVILTPNPQTVQQEGQGNRAVVPPGTSKRASSPLRLPSKDRPGRTPIGGRLVRPTGINVYTTVHHHTPSQSEEAAETFRDLVTMYSVNQVRAEAKARGDPSGSSGDPTETREPTDKKRRRS